MRRIILHVGTEKTGSTYLQSVFYKNRRLLKSIGVLYPLSGIESRHHYWLAKAFGFKSQPGSICEEVEEKALNGLRAELDAWPGEVLISSEHFDINVNRDSLRKLKEFFSGVKIEVILIARNQVAYSQSLYAEGLKWSVILPYDEFLRVSDKRERYSYLRRYELWREIGATVAIVDYENSRHNLLATFFKNSNLDVDISKLVIPRSTQNVTPSIDFLEMVRLCNVDREVSRRRDFFQSCFKVIENSTSDLLGKRNFRVPDNEVEIFERAQRSNEALADMLGEAKHGFLGGPLGDRVNEYASLSPPDPLAGMVKFMPILLRK